MLVQKNKDEIVILKMCNGDEIITKITNTLVNEYTVENPFVLIMGQQGMQFSPMLIMGDGDEPVTINKNSVVARAKPSKTMLTSYESATSKIAIPSKPGIII
jgi:hypothetical protein